MKNINLLSFVLLLLVSGCKKDANDSAKGVLERESSKDESMMEDKYGKALANANGLWHFEKASLYGGFIDGKDYYYTKEALDSIYKDVSFKISDYSISYSTGCSAGFSIEEDDLSIFFSGKLPTNFEDQGPSDEEIKAFYKKEFNIAMEDTIIMFNISGCRYPFNRLLVFPDKIIVIEYGACNFLFTKVPNSCEEKFDNKTINGNDEMCEKFEGNMSGGELCTYSGRTMEQVYQIILNKYSNESKHLKKVLPLNSVKYVSKVDDENIQITYNYENKNTLLIQLFYDGGITEIEIHEKNGNTISKITYNAD